MSQSRLHRSPSRRAVYRQACVMRKASVLAMLMVLAVSWASAQVVPDQYIVVLNDNPDSPAVTAQALTAQYNVQLGHVYEYALNGFSFRGSAAAAQALAQDPLVAFVEADLEAHAFHYGDPPPYESIQHLTTGVERIDADLNATANIDGIDDRVDVDVAIIDTGIDIDHPDLPRVYAGRHFYTKSWGRPSLQGSFEDDNYDDDYGHGTHVAGTIAALDNGMGVVGVAPGARLWAVKVLNAGGNGTFSDVIKGIDFVTANAGEIDVANMSLGGIGKLDSLRMAIQNSVNAGIVYVVAAGNIGMIGNNGMDVYGNDGIFDTSDDVIPAAYPEVATISAMADTDGQSGGLGPVSRFGTVDDTFPGFNFSDSVVAGNPVISPGAAIDLAGPGVDIWSTWKDDNYALGSGTSLAAPHVAGAAALEVAANGRALNAAGVAEIRQVLIDAAEPQSAWGPANTFDWDANPEGLVNVGASGAPNDRPVLSITSPANGSTFDSGTTIFFEGTASDTEDGDLTASLVWTSDLDGQIGAGASFSTTLSDGNHTITASATDSGAKTGSASVSITVGDPPAGAQTVSVSSVSYATNGGRNGDKNLLITVALVDDLGAAVANASVSIDLYRDEGLISSRTATTGAGGTATFTLKNARSGCYTTSVTDVLAAGLTWDDLMSVNQFCK